MFRHFSFSRPVSRPGCSHDAAAVCPTSIPPEPHRVPSRLPTPPPCLVGDLAQKLTQQSLRLDAPAPSATSSSSSSSPPPPSAAAAAGPAHLRHHAYAHEDGDGHAPAPPTPPSDEGSFPTELLGQPDRRAYCRVSASVLRMQRQANARMQCSSSHIRDISRLVQMVQRQEQCTVSTDSTLPPTAVEGVEGNEGNEGGKGDEAVDLDFDSPLARTNLVAATPLRRSGEHRVNPSARVAKTVRMRRRPRGHDANTARRVA